MRINHQAFFCSLFFVRLADQILLFLVPLVVFQTTQKVSWSGIAFFVEALPRYLFFPLFGALSDRFSPLKLMRISQTYRAVVCLAGVAGYALWGGIGWLITLSACCGILTSQGFVAREVMLPQIFKAHKFERVLAVSQLADQLGVVLGPMAAALLLGWWRWAFVVAATGALFLIADGAFVLWQRVSGFQAIAVAPPQGHWTQPLRTAVHHVAHLPGLKKVILLAAAENLVIGVTLATSAAMVTGIHHQSGRFYAVLQTIGAIATMLILLNNLTQPLAGLLVGVFAGRGQTGLLIVLLSLTMGVIGAATAIAGPWLQQKRAARIERDAGLNKVGVRERE